MSEFLKSLSGLLTPLIAMVTLYIAYQQWRTNDLKLKLDLYDRRLKVYEEVRGYLSRAMQHADVSYEDSIRFFRNCSEADFLFNPEVPQYIEELYRHGINLHRFHEQYRDRTQPTPPGYDHQKVVDGSHKEIMWFNNQFDPAKNLFRKYLSVNR